MTTGIDKRLTIQGIWVAREEDLDDAIKRINHTLQLLGQLSACWRHWYYTAPGQEAEAREFDVFGDLETIRERLISSQKPTDGGVPDYEVGYSVLFSSDPSGANESDRSHFYVSCCSRTSFSRNTISIRLPVPDHGKNLYDENLLSQCIVALQQIWDPDWLTVWDLRNKLNSGPSSPRVTLGWINYLANRTGVMPENLPTGWRWSPDRSNKQIFIYDAGPPDKSSPKDVVSFKEMFDCIKWQKIAF